MGTHAQTRTIAAAEVSRSRSAAPVRKAKPAEFSPLLRIQRSHGNQYVQRALKTMLQPKLLVNQPGDQYEQEADRVADAVMRMPAASVQRKCSCGNGAHEECEACKSKPSTLAQRKPAARASMGIGRLGHIATMEAPRSVESALLSPSRPLPEPMRTEWGSRLGYDFGQTRIHDNSAAHTSASDVSARAFTVGQHIVFGRGQFQPATADGRRLLAHELAHVMQQSGYQEAANSQLGARVSSTNPAVQRAPQDSWGTAGDFVLERALGATGIPSPLRTAAAASIRGFAAEARTQLASNKEAIGKRLNELMSFDALKSLFGGYIGGLGAGIISPLTGLFDMLVFADRLRVFVGHVINDATNKFAELVAWGRELAMAIGEGAAKLKAELTKLMAKPIELIVGLVTDQGPRKLEGVANKAGHDAVLATAAAVSKRFSPEKEPHEKRVEDAPLAKADAKIEEFKEKLFSTPWSKTGYDIGYGVGFAAINILMLVFSGGVGNILTKVGNVLGEMGGLLGKVGKLIGVLARAITFVEEAANAVMNVAMKPLQPLFRALEPHLQKLAVFLRKLLGIAEKEGAGAVAAAAKTTAAVTRPKPRVPRPAARASRAPAAISPHPSAPRPPSAAASTHPPGPAPAAAKRPGPAGAAEKPATVHEPNIDANEAKALERTRNLEHVDQGMIDDELNAARKVNSQPSTEPGYVEEKILPNGHTWRKNADGAWCRFSGKPTVCVSDLEEFLARGTQPPEPEFTAVPKDHDRVPEGFDEVRDKPNMDLRKVSGRSPSEALADALEAQGKPRPPGHEAHHIVPEGMEKAERAREIIETAGIKPNDAENGVWLRGWRPNQTTESFGSHLGIHNEDYVAGVTAILEEAQRTGTVKESLGAMGEMLEAGKINEIIKEGVRAKSEGVVTFEKAVRKPRK